MSAAQLRPNQRVSDSEGFRGTVRYIGPVCSSRDADAVWAGIEWDDASRGKHDGSAVDAEGHKQQYFECKPGHGSFVKPSKVSAGVDLLRALQQRYASAGDGDEVMAVQTAAGGMREIEFVGASKARSKQRLEQITEAFVDGEPVSSVGAPGSLSVCPMIQELSMQRALLSSWHEVSAIAMQFPQLRVLNLAGNRFTESLGAGIMRGAFRSLETLVLNGCDLSLDLLTAALCCTPALRQLHVANVGLRALPLLDPSLLPHLELVDLSGNQLADWRDMCRSLAPLTSLVRLHLNGTPLAEIPRDCVLEQLEALALSDTRLADWESVNALDRFPHLTELRLQRVPLLASHSPSSARQEIVARIGRLRLLNGGEVRDKERADCEKLYLKHCLRRALDRAGMSGGATMAEVPPEVLEQVRQEHPRFDALVATHGQPLAPQTDEGGASLSRDVVRLMLRSNASASATQAPTERRLLLSMTVAEVKTLCGRLFALEPARQRLFFKDGKDCAFPIPLDRDEETLADYGVVGGADREIIVEEYDAAFEAKRRAAAGGAAAGK